MLLINLFRPTAENITLALLVFTQILGGVFWYSTSIQKRFASETEWKKTIRNQQEIYKRMEELTESIKQLRDSINLHEDDSYKRHFEGLIKMEKELVEIKAALQNLVFSIRPQQPTSGWGQNANQ